MSGTVYPLQDNQAPAVDPRDSVWLSASAGTGKTQVLSARVLRLLLDPQTRPEQILCLTFTKAGAAEMANRVNAVLASWVRMPDEALFADLQAIGAQATEEERSRARTLFASVLDCPGGGLRIDTIHAFAQWLLAAFPEEAGIVPGTRPMEDRDRSLLADQVLSELVLDWQASDRAAHEALEQLSLRLGPDGAKGWLMRCAAARAAWYGPSGWQPPMRGRVARLLGLGADVNADSLADLCSDAQFAMPSLEAVRDAYAAWGAKSGLDIADRIGEWLAAPPPQRLAQLGDLAGAIFNKEGVPKYLKNIAKAEPAIDEVAERVRLAIDAVAEQATLLALVEFITPALEVGRKFALAWDVAKQREGWVDFDDLIRHAASLLKKSAMKDWIRYKLDRQFDHLLIDEAQDTNAEQWDIIDALTEEFYTGEGASGDKLRTIFVVGDYKQAIFGFQGTSPENFNAAFERYQRRMRERAANARALRESIEARELQDLDLGRSYRTAQDVLTFVDEALDAIGHEAIGKGIERKPHKGDTKRPGLVTLWEPVPGRPEDAEEEDGPELGISGPERRMADKIADEIKRMCDNGFPLMKGTHRNATPGDFMVLVRKRKELAGLIVARLYAKGVPVAGVDRLRLGAPLAVKDLLSALRFAAQPHDDLSLACLLVSPLFGWSQQDLLEHGYRDKHVSLWDHLRRSEHPQVLAALEPLRALLARADFDTPQVLLNWLLLGPWDARRKLIARLGRDAADPINELLNAAAQFASTHTASLVGFLHWFDAGEGELKREAEGGGDMVRVMTVHGSKGLQAPIVILADACGDPDASIASGLELKEDEDAAPIPVPALPSAEKVGPIAEADAAAKAKERQEHWRLLYVALTRAEEALFIGGALGKREKEPAPDSWYARLAPLFRSEPLENPTRWERGGHAPEVPARTQAAFSLAVPLPDWATSPIGEEPRPPRPLAPSASAEEQGSDPPLPAEQAAIAARRGVLIHALLERLPGAPEDMRASGGRAWLARHAPEMSRAEHEEMLDRAMAVLAEPQWRELFGPDALAEVPLSAIVGSEVITGVIDRLLVTPERVLVADFKTARRPPHSLAGMPQSTLRQMATYVAALEVIYPDRAIEAAVLYTQTPQIIALPPETIAAHKPNYAGT